MIQSRLASSPSKMMMLVVFTLVSFVCLPCASAWNSNTQICPLCATALIIPRRFQYYVAQGKTCLNVYVDIAPLNPSSSQCRSQQTAYRELCCGATNPPVRFSAPTGPPPYNGPEGNEPDCPICGTTEYPGLPTAFIRARYVGDYSCAQLYNRGLHGLIPNFMCGPLQDYA
jgi:hypothetical protein